MDREPQINDRKHLGEDNRSEARPHLDHLIVPGSANLPSSTTSNSDIHNSLSESPKSQRKVTLARFLGFGDKHLSLASLGKEASKALRYLSTGALSVRSWASENSVKDESQDRSRTIFFNIFPPADMFDESGRYQQKFSGNEIHTTKYNLFTFLPKNLFEQFRRIANTYFLTLVIIQIFPEYRLTSPYFVALPITTIVVITAIKDGFEDYRRRKSDNEINRTRCLALRHIKNFNHPSKLKFSERLKVNARLLKRRLKRWYFEKKHKYSQDSIHMRRISEYRVSSTGDIFESEVSLNQSQDERTAVPKSVGGEEPTWGKKKWQDIRVGDVLFLSNNQPVPADIVILSTSEEDALCFVETKNLDGETNLKVREGSKATSFLKDPVDFENFQCSIQAEAPSSNVHSFSGSLSINRPNGQSSLLSVSIENLLLRGCTIRNTRWVIGIVVYAGKDSKLIMNSGSTPSKRSRIEKLMNPQVLGNLFLVFIVCLIMAIAHSIYLSFYGQIYAPYMDQFFLQRGSEISDASRSLFVFVASLIMFQNLVPISLYVTIEFVKTAQAYFIYSDIDMYDDRLDTTCVPRTWSIADDLGQIEYIFSDKTGTLTRNVMEFRKCSIGGVMYGGYHTNNDKEKKFEKKHLSLSSYEVNMLELLERNYQNPYNLKTLTFVDEGFVKDLYGGDAERVRKNKEFFTHLSICHSVIPEYPDPHNPYKLIYQAQSPDEAALVAGARDLGFTFLEKSNEEIMVNIMGELLRFRVLNVLEFTSSRKKMSIICKTPEGKIRLFSKGADNVILEGLAPGQKELEAQTLEHLNSFAGHGLRTLCLAYRDLEEHEFKAWEEEYKIASTSIEDREEKVERVAKKIEKNFILLGATAIEDRLQEGVPECIARLSKSGIKIWVLTGDKMETAINIGFSCNLLTKEMSLIVVRGKNPSSISEQLKDAWERAQSIVGEGVDVNGVPRTKVALIMDGNSLKHALEKEMKPLLVKLTTKCSVVICCRASPKQKAQVVSAIKKSLKAMTLAIGDGANDVSMIQEADVGVGIQGHEGMQAAMSSDYAIGQFSFLNKLLLVHGRWAYFRTSEMTLLMFYKNVVWTMALFWYQIFCGWSASILYNYFLVLFYNLFYTGLTPIVLGAFDQDISAKHSIAVPEAYIHGINQQLYSAKIFALYILDGFYQSLIVYFGSHLASGDIPVVINNSASSDKIIFGMVAATSGVTIANLYMALNIYHWTWIIHFSIWGSLIVFLGIVAVYSLLPQSTLNGILWLLISPNYWFSVIIIVVIALLPRYLIKYVQQLIWPSDVDILREMEKYHPETQDWEEFHSKKTS